MTLSNSTETDVQIYTCIYSCGIFTCKVLPGVTVGAEVDDWVPDTVHVVERDCGDLGRFVTHLYLQSIMFQVLSGTKECLVQSDLNDRWWL